MTPNPIKNQFILTPSFLDEPLLELKSLVQPGWIINEFSLPNGSRQTRIAAINKRLSQIVVESILAGRRPVSIAGDCLSAIGVLTGLQRAGADPFLFWFDAHGDFNTRETSPSGFLGGMPLAMIVGRGEKTIARAVGLKPMSEARVVLTDARDLDPGERESLEQSNVIRLGNPKTLMERPVPDGPVYVHVDTDIIALEEAPAQNYPAPGGLSGAELEAVFRRLAQKGQIIAVSVSTWNPRLEQAALTEKSSMSLLESLIF